MLKLDSVCDWYIKVYTYSVVQNSKIPEKNTIYIQSCEQRCMLICYLIIIIKKKYIYSSQQQQSQKWTKMLFTYTKVQLELRLNFLTEQHGCEY